jgi:DnaJ-class molecular chaperone
MNPYNVLGLPQTATKEEIKQRYKTLARQNHPDKLQDVLPEERKEREEYFKNVTVAYHVLMDQQSCDTNYPKSPEYWKDIWAKMEEFVNKKNVWGSFVDVASKYIRRKKHKIKVPVTLEEIYANKQKKIQLFLQGVIEPVHKVVSCGHYPSMQFEYESADGGFHIVDIVFVENDHPYFTMDENGNLSVSIAINLVEYIHGTSKSLPFLDGNQISLEIQPFSDIHDVPITLQGYGITKNEDLYVYVCLQGVDKQSYESLDTLEQSAFISTLQKIS